MTETIMEHIETDDIFRCASLLCMGAELAEVHKSGVHITFLMNGEELKMDDMNYRMGKARVNPLQLKENVNLLRDLIHENLRQKKKDNRHGHRTHAAA